MKNSIKNIIKEEILKEVTSKYNVGDVFTNKYMDILIKINNINDKDVTIDCYRFGKIIEYTENQTYSTIMFFSRMVKVDSSAWDYVSRIYKTTTESLYDIVHKGIHETNNTEPIYIENDLICDITIDEDDDTITYTIRNFKNGGLESFYLVFDSHKNFKVFNKINISFNWSEFEVTKYTFDEMTFKKIWKMMGLLEFTIKNVINSKIEKKELKL